MPALKRLVTGDIPDDQKYKLLAFITDNIIDEGSLKDIPLEYLLHVVILVHLVNNESLEVFEARAFAKALKDVVEDTLPAALIYPEVVNIRAFRTSYLLTAMHYQLTRCLSTIGLAALNVSFRKYFRCASI